MYDASLGKFIQVDPVSLVLTNEQKLKEQTGQTLDQVLSVPQSFNTYSYTINNPIKYNDPEGEWFKEFFTGKQSWSSFQSEIGQASMYLGPTWQKAMDHPYATGAIVGVGSGVLAAGATLATGGSIVCGMLCGSTAATVATTGGTLVSTQGDKIQKAVDFTSRYGSSLGSKMNQVTQNLGEAPYKFSEHSIMRIAQKVGVGNEGRVTNILNNIKPFEYFHENAWKLGYYDSVSKIFVGQVKSSQIITTVSTNVAQNYINNLIK